MQCHAFFQLHRILSDLGLHKNHNDTCVVKINQSGGTQQTDISSTTSVFSGYLVC